MPTRRTVYRDYRAGKSGQFTNKKAFDNQGPADGVHRERITEPETIEDVAILFEYDDYDSYDDFVEDEFHGTGDT